MTSVVSSRFIAVLFLVVMHGHIIDIYGHIMADAVCRCFDLCCSVRAKASIALLIRVNYISVRDESMSVEWCTCPVSMMWLGEGE